jgi:hypothetical protein
MPRSERVRSDNREPESNCLPSPEGKPFMLTFRTYVPKEIVKTEWVQPPVEKVRRNNANEHGKNAKHENHTTPYQPCSLHLTYSE